MVFVCFLLQRHGGDMVFLLLSCYFHEFCVATDGEANMLISLLHYGFRLFFVATAWGDIVILLLSCYLH